jgi:hypothetical protein
MRALYASRDLKAGLPPGFFASAPPPSGLAGVALQGKIMADEIKNPFHSVVARNNNKWFAILHGVLVTDPCGQGAEFDTESDAGAFLAEAAVAQLAWMASLTSAIARPFALGDSEKTSRFLRHFASSAPLQDAAAVRGANYFAGRGGVRCYPNVTPRVRAIGIASKRTSRPIRSTAGCSEPAPPTSPRRG